MNLNIKNKSIHILLADDDIDDCFFFQKAINEISSSIKLTIVYNGEQLIDYLTNHIENLPHILFLDLSMPKKTGFECLSEIKENSKFNTMPVIMFSTSYTLDSNYEKNMIDMLSSIGAQEYIRKPGDYIQLKKVISEALVKFIP